MKSKQIVLTLFAISLIPSVSFTQQIKGRYWYVDEIEVKQKKVLHFEQQLMELSIASSATNFPHSYSVCKSIDNTYFVFHEISGTSEITELVAAKERMIEDLGFSRSHKKCMQSRRTFVIRDIPSLNYIPVEPRLLWEDVGFTAWEVHTVKQDQIEAYKENLLEFQSVKGYMRYDDPSFVFEIVQGAEAPTFVLMSYGRDQEDRQREDSRLWQVIGNEGKQHFEHLYPYMTNQTFLQLWKLDEASYRVQIVEETL